MIRQTYLLMTHTTDAEWRATAKEVSDALIAFGWVKTADTGQIDWTTVLRPSASNQFRGYEIFAPVDTLQATVPFYVKIEYGSSSSSSAFSWRFTMGAGTNGAGLLSGLVTASQTMDLASSSGGSPDVNGKYLSLFCGSGAQGRFVAFLGYSSTASSLGRGIVNIERLKTAVGADANTGAYLLSISQNLVRDQILPASGTVPAANSSGVGCMMPTGSGGSGMVGANVTVYPVYPFDRKMLPPIRGVASYFGAELPQQSVVSASIYGIAQDWMTGFLSASMSPARAGSVGVEVMIRWE